jgi:hypothetical protein
MSSPPDGRLSSSFSPTEATIPQAKDSHSSRLPLRKKKAFYNVSSSAMAQANVATTLSNQTTDVQAVIKEKKLATSIHLDEKKNKQTSIKAASSSRGGSPNKVRISTDSWVFLLMTGSPTNSDECEQSPWGGSIAVVE